MNQQLLAALFESVKVKYILRKDNKVADLCRSRSKIVLNLQKNKRKGVYSDEYESC